MIVSYDYDFCDCCSIYRAAEDDLKRMEEDAAFIELLTLEKRDQARESRIRQERRNISLRARGDNHYRKVHCGLIKARKGWR